MATKSTYEAIAVLNSLCGYRSIEVRGLSRITGAISGPFLFNFFEEVSSLNLACKGGRSDLISPLICNRFAMQLMGSGRTERNGGSDHVVGCNSVSDDSCSTSGLTIILLLQFLSE